MVTSAKKKKKCCPKPSVCDLCVFKPVWGLVSHRPESYWTPACPTGCCCAPLRSWAPPASSSRRNEAEPFAAESWRNSGSVRKQRQQGGGSRLLWANTGLNLPALTLGPHVSWESEGVPTVWRRSVREKKNFLSSIPDQHCTTLNLPMFMIWRYDIWGGGGTVRAWLSRGWLDFYVF